MRKFLSLVALMAFAIHAPAMIYHCDKFNTSKKTCRLIGWSGSQPSSTKLKLPTTFTHTDGETYTITEVEEHALDNLTDVTEITIPASYKKIGDAYQTYIVNSTTDNFNNCPSLKYFKVESGSALFEADADGALYLKGKKELLNIPASYQTSTGTFTLTENCKNVSPDAFAGNSTIHTVVFARDVEVFENGGLNRMTKLNKIRLTSAETTELTLSSGVLINKNRVVSAPPKGDLATYSIASNIQEVSSYAFYGCASLKSVTLSSSIIKIGDNAFAGSGLTSLTIPEGVDGYGKKMVAECPALKSVNFKSKCALVSDRFAENCPVLTKIESTYPLESVGESAFKNCRELKSFPFRGETVMSEDSSFYNTGLEKVVFEPSEIADYFSGEYLFAYCRNLTEINFSSLMMDYVDADLAIGPGYAAGCLKLKTLRFGDYTGFWHYNPDEHPTPPAFGYSCMVDTIYISSTSTVVSPQFVYSTYMGKQHFTPKMYVTTTKNYGYSPLYNSLPIGRMFSAGNGATVAPLIYLDAYQLEEPRWPEYIDYVVPDATYFIPGGTSPSYSLAVERGNKVVEMFDISFYKTPQNTMKISPSLRKNISIDKFPEVSDFRVIINDDQVLHAAADGSFESVVPYSQVSKVRLSYKVDGNYFLTDYPNTHWLSTGITLSEKDADIKINGKIIEFSYPTDYEIYSADGCSLMKGKGVYADLSLLNPGIILITYRNEINNINTLKIKL